MTTAAVKHGLAPPERPEDITLDTHTRVPVCAGKAGFDAPDLAAKVARRMRQNHQARVREYRCHDCGCWHIGNPKPRGKDAPKSKRDR